MNMGVGTNTTYFVGAHYEVTNGTITKYYYAGSQRIALRTNGTLNFLLGDHLGSTSLTTDATGVVISEMRYKAWGETRYASGTTPTKYQYTGQYSYATDFGLHFYNARWYDSSLSRFAQADSIIPLETQGVQAWDRFAYTNNNPIRYTDPSGHRCSGGGDENIWGYCELPVPNKVTTYQKVYLNVVARKYGIKLAPADYWEYAQSIMSGEQRVLGWAPEKPNDPYRDASGTQHAADDSAVFITSDLLNSCNSTDCAAGIMAHEATHSWIEFKIEATGQERNDTDPSLSAAEEASADLVAIAGMGDPQGMLEQHKNDMLRNYSDPRTTFKYLEDFYGIDLSDIFLLVYGR